jgi:hypothetical protein
LRDHNEDDGKNDPKDPPGNPACTNGNVSLCPFDPTEPTTIVGPKDDLTGETGDYADSLYQQILNQTGSVVGTVSSDDPSTWLFDPDKSIQQRLGEELIVDPLVDTYKACAAAVQMPTDADKWKQCEIGVGLTALSFTGGGKVVGVGVRTAEGIAAAQAERSLASRLMGQIAKRCTPNSFTSDTRVLMADGTTKRIDEIQLGDKVVSANAEDGVPDVQEVTALIVGVGEKKLVDIKLETRTSPLGLPQRSTVTATDGHPFYVESTKTWVQAGDLKLNNELRSSQRGVSTKIIGISRRAERTSVFNLTVSVNHAYYVTAGSTPVLVHNAGPAGGTDGGWYGQLQPAGSGYEINHIPAKSSYGGLMSEYSGPAIRMEYADHRALYSTGSSREAKAWQAMQRDLVATGKIDQAMAMDVQDIRSRFGGKYDAAIKEMYDSLPNNKSYAAYKVRFSGC